ncbi:MAG TPA: aspartate/glutamate racemase family protein [Bryobacteraceae bacterium]|nr:aspartate/glutamate racemase family protein [Bryobacteraceae bacterium]
MAAKLAFVHTSHVLIPLFSKLASEIIHEVEIFHISDESLIRNTIAAQRLTASTTRRLAKTIESAFEGGADAVMVTCSSIGPGVNAARALFDAPVLRVDEPMAELAVQTGKRVGVAATLRTTLEPTIALIELTALQQNRAVEIIPSLAEGAFEAVLAGNTERHDALLVQALNELRRKVDVVVLAQASMARVLPQLSTADGPPILSSPELAVRNARRVLLGNPAIAR